MNIMQMTSFRNKQSILTKLLLNSEADWIDPLFHNTVTDCKQFSKLWSVTRQIVVVSRSYLQNKVKVK